MDTLSKLEELFKKSGDVKYEDYQKLRQVQEYVNDLEDQIEGRFNNAYAEELALHASGPALGIVVGHTEKRPGASGTSPISQSEYPWNKSLANMIRSKCQARGVEARIFFRDNIGISAAYQQVLSWGAACAVELHFNAFNTTARGTETLYDNDKNSGSKRWAQYLQSAMLHALGTKDRGLKECDPGHRGYRSVSAIDIPTALIEPFFGDNPQDAMLGHSRKQELADAIAETAARQLVTS